ncbi:HoxN/HupN/NixA family nickel/cobalt transporter [Swaminathania salitolerans]|uniref:Nickel/cobalt efflux system n=1 Tax=Swaminathania salitolerans TaxID=182838 RepID=A0A511BKZ0_9PROT|nr:HoxN/HupN/NixA family nickel/cobalt transporter [Swaminathania salitolerans]GBQ09345.1 transporter with high-affinity to nickel [Swaminathania salitolerans LMG 21291]GEL01011.1 nickel/cobalt efflux system [Swaminathania salitolerans]
MSGEARIPSRLRTRVLALGGGLFAVNLGLWVWTFLLFRGHPLLLGNALLAYGFGLRHAVDADHIASIDNVTRKFVQMGRMPVLTGFWFAIGHSLIVVLAALGTALLSHALQDRFGAWRDIGSVASTLVSAGFLFALAVTNFVVLCGAWKAYRALRQGRSVAQIEQDALARGGLLARLLSPLFRLVTRSWHMVLLGFLFGLGFDTATEVSLLGLSASEATRGVSVASIMIFPALFAAGMALIDTADGVLMLGAYRWAFVDPMRKLRYNIAITLVSVIVAVGIGSIETLRLLGDRIGFSGAAWRVVIALSDSFNTIGFIVIGVFILAWGASLFLARTRRKASD